MSWADICETSDKEDNKFDSSKEVAENVKKYGKSKVREPEAEVIEDKKSNEDALKHAESKNGESGATESVESTEYSTMRNSYTGWIKQVGVQSGCGARKFLLQIRENPCIPSLQVGMKVGLLTQELLSPLR